MKIVPVFKCKDIQRSLAFYSDILGFRIKHPAVVAKSPVLDLIYADIEIQLSILSGDGVFGSAVNVVVDDVNGLFRSFVRRGLDTSDKTSSPVHQGPVNQSWGTREFYVTDPDGNTLRFRQFLE